MIQRNVLNTPTGCPGFILFFIIGWLIPVLLRTVSSQSTFESRLLLVFTLSRHGDRSPANALIRDPYSMHWSAGYGQLTELGVAQHMELGQFIRNRYGSFIPQTYHKDECFFRSSGMHRTLQSANSFLLGLYQTSPQQESRVVPPVFSTPESDDHLLTMSHNCPRYTEHLHTLMNSPAVVEKMNSFETTVDTLKLNFPQMYAESNGTRSSQFLPTCKICDHILIWVAHNLPLRPPWLTDHIVRECQNLLDYKMFLDYSTPTMRRFRGGPLAAHLIRLFRDRANVELRTKRPASRLIPEPLGMNTLSEDENKQDVHRRRRRLIAYFAHDSTLSALMSHLRVFNGHQPPLASCLLVELHHLPHSEGPSQEKFFLRFIYRNSSFPRPRPPVPLWPPVCGPAERGPQLDYLCSLTRLESALWDTYVLHNRTDECNPTISTHHLRPVSAGKTFLSSVDRYYIPLFVIILCQFFLMLYLVVRLNLRILLPYERLQS